MATRRERHNTYYANLYPQRAAYLVMSKISVVRDPKNTTTSFNGQNPTPNGRIPNSRLNVPISTDSFQNPQILWTISSGHVVILTPAPFPVWGFIMTMLIVISFAHEHNTATTNYALELRDANSSKPYQTD